MNMLDIILQRIEQDNLGEVTKEAFGRMVHSDDPEEVERAMAMLEKAGGYENLED